MAAQNHAYRQTHYGTRKGWARKKKKLSPIPDLLIRLPSNPGPTLPGSRFGCLALVRDALLFEELHDLFRELSHDFDRVHAWTAAT